MATATDEIYVKIIAQTSEAIAGISEFAKVLGAFGVSWAAVKKIVIDSTKEYIADEQAITRLGFALKLTGQYSKQTAADMESMARSLAMNTTYSAAATETAAGLLLQLSDLTTQGVQKAIPLIQDLSTALGMDLSTSAEMFAKAMDTGILTTRKFTINVKDILDPAERFDALILKLKEDMGGMSETMGQTLGGQFEILKNQINELKSNLGGLFASLAMPGIKAVNLGFAANQIFNADINSASSDTLSQYIATMTSYVENLQSRKGTRFMDPAELLKAQQLLAYMQQVFRDMGGNKPKPNVGGRGGGGEAPYNGTQNTMQAPGNSPDYFLTGLGGSEFTNQSNYLPGLGPSEASNMPPFMGGPPMTGAMSGGGFGGAAGQAAYQASQAVTSYDTAIKNLEKDMGDAMGGNLGSFFTALGAAAASGQSAEAAFTSFVSSLMSQIGSMMIVAGLNMMITAKDSVTAWTGLGIAVAGGLTAIAGGAIGASGSGASSAAASTTTGQNPNKTIVVNSVIQLDGEPVARSVAIHQARW